MNPISVIIHTYNEEKHIAECIQSALFLTQDVIVIDMFSNDDTVQLAKKMGTTIFLHPYTSYVEPSREFGISKATGTWIFLLDADERLTEKLCKTLKEIIQPVAKETHYKVARKNIFGGKKWLQHGGWWPDSQMRFFKKEALIEWPKQIHSTPKFKGSLGYVDEPFLHMFHGDIKGMVEKTILYEGIESDLLYKANKPVSVSTFFRKFLAELYRRLIKKQGYRDGSLGILESMYQAFSKTITYILLYEKKKTSRL
jgi:glycosyltransferase involved in cell wall biosynthesis